MRRAQNRVIVLPKCELNPGVALQEHLVKNVRDETILVQEYTVLCKEKLTPFWMRDLIIPHWLLAFLISLVIVAFTAFALFAVFASIGTLKNEGNGGPCKKSSDCRQDLLLVCNINRCGCAYSHFWSDTNGICERRRMINQTCLNDSECDAQANLLCMSVTLAGNSSVLECQFKTGMSWIISTCYVPGLYQDVCLSDLDCDNSRFLYCANVSAPGQCLCNSSMFWIGVNYDHGTCEYKRTINQYCLPYDDSWCDNTGPVGQGLICANYTNPYGSAYGICQCPATQFYNGTASLSNGYCVDQSQYGGSCASVLNCDYRVNLVCTNGTCTCATGKYYDNTSSIGGGNGNCVSTSAYMQNCTASLLCNSSQNLYCDYTYYNLSSVGLCNCNASWSYWDGFSCASKLSIGGNCTNNTQCISAYGLFCSNYTPTMNQCDCVKNHYWNNTCMTKLLYNESCSSSDECYDNRGLQCQNLTGNMFQKCDCYNDSYIWDSLYIPRNQTCIPKLGNNASGCHGPLECQDYNYLICANGTCKCDYTDYWDGSRCQPRKSYTIACASTYECQNYLPISLICGNQNLSCTGTCCVCPTGYYWEPCLLRCFTVKNLHDACILPGGNCTSDECDFTSNLQCINDLVNNQTGGNGYCERVSTYMQNCTAGLRCSTLHNLFCDYTYYNLSSVGLCNCSASWSYWDGVTCASKLSIGGNCTNNTQCLSVYGLFCSNYTPTMNQCDCVKNHYWNDTCTPKLLYNESCTSSYECDDNRGLQCQGLGGNMFQKCDCYNDSYIWDSLYIPRNQTCIPKLGNNASGCHGPLECQDYNYLICANGTCKCDYTDYWDGSRCQPRKSYTIACASTYECQNYLPISLICGNQNLSCTGTCCVCPTGYYWETCLLRCLTVKKRQQACTLPGGNCTSDECDFTSNLQCINDSVNNQTGGYGWCNCTSLQWWNGTYCRNKGTPAWGVNTSALCNATYQCADYNLVSCPLGGNWPTINSTCECATTKYWNGVTCLDRVTYNQPCTLWANYPVNTSTCLSAAGAGLYCTSSSCNRGICTGGTCQCPFGTSWNSTFLMCGFSYYG